MNRWLRQTYRPVLAIALNSFAEAFRNKVFGSIVLFPLFAGFLSYVLGQMSLHQELRTTIDLTLVGSMVVAVLVTVYASITLFGAEFEKRTIYTILSKPIARWQFLLGKLIGVAALMAVIVGALLLISFAFCAPLGAEFTGAFAAAYFCLWLQIAILSAIALFFSCFASPLLAGIVSSGIFIAGNLISQLEAVKTLLKSRGIEGLIVVVDVVKAILPNLEALNLSEQLTYDVPIHSAYVLSATWYAFSYVAVVFLACVLVFSFRDLQ